MNLADGFDAFACVIRNAIVKLAESQPRAERARAFVTEMYAWPAVSAKWLHAYTPDAIATAAASGAG